MIQRKGNIFHALGLEELILLKWPLCQKQSTDLIQSYQNTHDIFQRTRTNNLKIYLELQKKRMAKEILRKKEQSWRYNPLNFKYTTNIQ